MLDLQSKEGTLKEADFITSLRESPFIIIAGWAEPDSYVVKSVMSTGVPIFCVRAITCRYFCDSCGVRLNILNWDDEELVYLSFAKFLYKVKEGKYRGGTQFIKVTVRTLLIIKKYLGRAFTYSSSSGSNENVLWDS
jgi:hypothetical protein